jgi:hypothetical protein
VCRDKDVTVPYDVTVVEHLISSGKPHTAILSLTVRKTKTLTMARFGSLIVSLLASSAVGFVPHKPTFFASPRVETKLQAAPTMVIF